MEHGKGTGLSITALDKKRKHVGKNTMSTTEEKHNYTYIVRCKDGTYYTGWTNNLEKRMKAHNEGRGGAKYTRSRRPVVLVYYEESETPEEAMSREWHIKQMSRSRKEELIRNFQPDSIQKP